MSPDYHLSVGEKSFLSWELTPNLHDLNVCARDHTANCMSLEFMERGWEKLTRTFFFLQSSQAFMMRMRCACSLCSLDLVPRLAELVTSTPSLVMMEKPGSLNSAFFKSFFADFFETRAARGLPGDDLLVEILPESPKATEELGEAV